MMHTTKYILSALGALFLFVANAQNYPITNGTLTTCTGQFLDDGLGDTYSNNSYTFTICPETAGSVIQLNFTQFDLWLGNSIAASDQFWVFDGPTTAAPSLGIYVGNTLQFQQITGTINNTSGCITIAFMPNSTGNPEGEAQGWKADISCVIPCNSPVANAAITNPAPAGNEQLVTGCAGAEVTFSGAASVAQNGFTLQTYTWNFGDGTSATTNTPTITHVYAQPGGYEISLVVTDNNNCSSAVSEMVQVVIIPFPNFDLGAFSEEICLGQTILLDATGVEAAGWASVPPQMVEQTTLITPGLQNAYTSSLVFNQFEPDAVLESCNDFWGVYMNIEHSRVGDLKMELSCPNGTTASILNFPNGGGSAFLGEAVDDPQDLPGVDVEGVGFTYEWSPTATNGNINNQAPNLVSYVTQTGILHTANIVPAGTYQPFGDFCAFVGCPLNGEWTLKITDNFNPDNGHVFYWGIDLNPFLFPDAEMIVPVIGMNADSSFWTGEDITPITPDGNVVAFTPTALGDYNFTFSTTNNFGCVQDTTFSINVIQGPIADAGADIVVCGSGQLDGSVDGLPQPEPTCTYTIEMFDTFGDGWNGFSVTILQDGISLGTFTFNSGTQSSASFQINHGSSLQITTIGGSWDSEVSYFIYDNLGGVFFSDAGTIVSGTSILIGTNIYTAEGSCLPGIPNYFYQWTPTSGISDPSLPNPTVSVNQNTVYTLTVWQEGYPECIGTDEVLVSVPAELNPGVDTEIWVCFNDPAFEIISALNGDPAENGSWSNPLGGIVFDTFDPADYPDGATVELIYSLGNDSCTTSALLTINVVPGLDVPNGVDMIITLDFDTLIAPFEPNWSYQWFLNGVAINGANENTYIANQNGSYTVQIGDGICNEFLDAFEFNSTSISENESSLWSTFPVPFAHELQISGIAAISEVRIWSADGKEVFVSSDFTTNSKSVRINTANWLPGVYVVRVSSQNNVEVLKVVRR